MAAEPSPAPVESESPKLAELLQSGWRLLEAVEASNEPSASAALQQQVKRGLAQLEQATRMASELDLFSRNEELEEIASADLKYLLLPALLGALTLKQANPSKRLEQVQSARIYFLDFLKRCKEYNIAKFELPKTKESPSEPPAEESANDTVPAVPPPDLVAMATHRQGKIERYAQRKEAETRLASIRETVESGQAEEEQVREYYLLQLRRWINLSLDELESLEQEVEILKGREGMKQLALSSRGSRRARPPMQPFILTRDAVQAKVFGAGYPSLATMTVDEWYDQHRLRGALPDQGIPRRAAGQNSAEEEEQTKEEEEDDDESVRKARAWDDWKDEHRRGYGNRKNMG
ncbi:immunoglobulin-binding protein 1 [Ambystoma mexicanum]|uniref:immunoglobulin-binding protein 1 n=1 Tax=Ambystoma mexicanum TaxID=8296 RepID=UPI0037E6FD15